MTVYGPIYQSVPSKNEVALNRSDWVSDLRLQSRSRLVPKSEKLPFQIHAIRAIWSEGEN